MSLLKTALNWRSTSMSSCRRRQRVRRAMYLLTSREFCLNSTGFVGHHDALSVMWPGKPVCLVWEATEVTPDVTSMQCSSTGP